MREIYHSVINIPAYDESGNGILVTLRIMIHINEGPIIVAKGNIAIALESNFQRVIEIISSTKKEWECFENYSYLLECNNDNLIVKDSKSSSMAMCIALFNIYRDIFGKKQIQNISGTGVLRIDGSFENSKYEIKKRQIAEKSVGPLAYFVTSNECSHLYELERLMCL